MQLIVPYLREVEPEDSRLLTLATFLGIQCEVLALDKKAGQPAEALAKAAPDRPACLVVNPRVFQQWTGGDSVPAGLISFITACFRNVFVHGLRHRSFDSNLIAALSEGQLEAVLPVDSTNYTYDIEKDARDVCEVFSGLSFGPTNPTNDSVFRMAARSPGVRKLISIGGRPFMACIKPQRADIVLVASEDVVDLDSAAGGSLLGTSFSRLVPQVMALRHVFGEHCWRPIEQRACVIIDDPILRLKYGFLNFENLLRLLRTYTFHASIAFIPHNENRNSRQVVQLFRHNSDYLSICFHGNDHTEAELASTNSTLLTALLRMAEARMKRHEEKFGLPCDKVMVFPQGAFSLEAMEVLKTSNFYAAVNTSPYPVQEYSPLTVRDLVQPAVLRYSGFPLFLRRYVNDTESADLAFNLFFGKPVLIVEHHDIFRNPESLVDLVRKVNTLAPDIHWSRLEDVVAHSVLTRRAPDGTLQVLAYSGTVRVSNESDHIERLAIEWAVPGAMNTLEHVLDNGTLCPGVEVNERGVRVLTELAHRSSRTFSLVNRKANNVSTRLGIGWTSKAFLRRRLSELRDNYLCRSPLLLSMAQTLRERYLSRF